MANSIVDHLLTESLYLPYPPLTCPTHLSPIPTHLIPTSHPSPPTTHPLPHLLPAPPTSHPSPPTLYPPLIHPHPPLTLSPISYLPHPPLTLSTHLSPAPPTFHPLHSPLTRPTHLSLIPTHLSPAPPTSHLPHPPLTLSTHLSPIPTHLIPTASRVHVLQQLKVGHVLGRVLSGLHLTIHHTGILSLSIDMVHLSQVGCVLEGGEGSGEEGRGNNWSESANNSSIYTKASYSCGLPTALPPALGAETHCQCWIEDVVQVDGEEVEESLAAGCSHCVAGVVHVGPCVGALRQTSVGQQVQYTLHSSTWSPWQHTVIRLPHRRHWCRCG